jgi:hypothetical protein
MSTFVLNGAFYSLPYDVFNDFAPISALAVLPLVLVASKTTMRQRQGGVEVHDGFSFRPSNSNAYGGK